jgi:hypothetical protein
MCMLAAAALLIMFFLEYFDMLSGGALGSLTVGLVTCYAWEHGKPAKLSLGPNQNFSADVERVMAVVSVVCFLPQAREGCICCCCSCWCTQTASCIMSLSLTTCPGKCAGQTAWQRQSPW